MKTIKIIDLYNKIANGEEVPKKFRYKNINSVYELIEGSSKYDYRNEHNNIFENSVVLEQLNDELEIIEDTPKEYINVSEEQVLFNNLSYEEQQFILKQMRMLQPCKLESNGE